MFTLDVGSDVKALLGNVDTIYDGLLLLPKGLAEQAHAMTHTTISPNVIRGGARRNVIPSEVIIELDVRLHGEDSAHAVCEGIRRLLAEFGDSVRVEARESAPATSSPYSTETWVTMERAVQGILGRAQLLPVTVTATTDIRYYRRLGIPAYGLGLLSPSVTAGEYWRRFHGCDERIDLQSLSMSRVLWRELAVRLLS
jgi:acetylornithine deacetylase/succinyl-diaminopimelate desuccinylase-like protein